MFELTELQKMQDGRKKPFEERYVRAGGSRFVASLASYDEITRAAWISEGSTLSLEQYIKTVESNSVHPEVTEELGFFVDDERPDRFMSLRFGSA